MDPAAKLASSCMLLGCSGRALLLCQLQLGACMCCCSLMRCVECCFLFFAHFFRILLFLHFFLFSLIFFYTNIKKCLIRGRTPYFSFPCCKAFLCSLFTWSTFGCFVTIFTFCMLFVWIYVCIYALMIECVNELFLKLGENFHFCMLFLDLHTYVHTKTYTTLLHLAT